LEHEIGLAGDRVLPLEALVIGAVLAHRFDPRLRTAALVVGLARQDDLVSPRLEIEAELAARRLFQFEVAIHEDSPPILETAGPESRCFAGRSSYGEKRSLRFFSGP